MASFNVFPLSFILNNSATIHLEVYVCFFFGIFSALGFTELSESIVCYLSLLLLNYLLFFKKHFVLLSISSVFETPIIHIWDYLVLCHSSLILQFFSLVFSLYFGSGNFYLPIFKCIDFFFFPSRVSIWAGYCWAHQTNSSSLIACFPFFTFLSDFISLLRLSICVFLLPPSPGAFPFYSQFCERPSWQLQHKCCLPPVLLIACPLGSEWFFLAF